MEKKEGKEYPPLPKEVYQVQLLEVTDEQKPTYDTKKLPEAEQVLETILSFQFTLLEGKDDEDKDLRGRNVWANFVQGMLYIGKNGKNKLYRIVEALLGRELTQEEEAKGITGTMLNELIGKQCRLNVEPVVKGDKTYDNITDWLKSKEDLAPLTDEEKKEATVTKKEEAPKEEAPKAEDNEEEIDIEAIPF